MFLRLGFAIATLSLVSWLGPATLTSAAEPRTCPSADDIRYCASLDKCRSECEKDSEASCAPDKFMGWGSIVPDASNIDQCAALHLAFYNAHDAYLLCISGSKSTIGDPTTRPWYACKACLESSPVSVSDCLCVAFDGRPAWSCPGGKSGTGSGSGTTTNSGTTGSTGTGSTTNSGTVGTYDSSHDCGVGSQKDACQAACSKAVAAYQAQQVTGYIMKSDYERCINDTEGKNACDELNNMSGVNSCQACMSMKPPLTCNGSGASNPSDKVCGPGNNPSGVVDSGTDNDSTYCWGSPLCFDGALAYYSISNGNVVINAGQISNKRKDATSGSITLTLWASKTRYHFGDTLTGYVMAEVTASPLTPGGSYPELKLSAPFNKPPAGTYQVTLVMSEGSNKRV